LTGTPTPTGAGGFEETASGGGGLSDTAKIGMGIGIGVGAAVLIATALFVWYWIRTRAAVAAGASAGTVTAVGSSSRDHDLATPKSEVGSVGMIIGEAPKELGGRGITEMHTMENRPTEMYAVPSATVWHGAELHASGEHAPAEMYVWSPQAQYYR
jgi:hypothetical protein